MEVNVYFSDFVTHVDMSPMEFSVIPARGPAGADGAPGQDGRDGTIENLNVTATTLSAGSSATATYANNLLTLGIPRGNTGSKGNTGNTGPTGNGISSIEKTGTEGRVDTYTITMTNGTTSTFTVTNGMDVVVGIVNTASGDVATFADGGDDLPVDDLTVGIEYAQDLHGYDSPWPAGGGKNLLNPTPSRDSSAGLTFTTDGASLIVNGTNTSAAYTGSAITKEGARFTLPAGTYTLSLFTSPTDTVDSYINVEFYDSEGTKTQKVIRGNNKTSQTFTFTEDMVYDWWFSIPAGTYNNVAVRFQLESGNTATSFAPYSNICPITGWTGANIYREDEYDSGATATYTVSWQSTAGTVYGGTLDVTNGKLTVDRANIASYAGETLPGAWISSMDAYASGATPTTGAQVVYELASPVTYDLTPTEVRTLNGDNAIWADTGSTTVRYYTDTYVDVLNELLEMIPMDNAMSTTSENAVQNKVIAAAVNAKADSADVYTKTQTDTLLSAKANSADVYTKTQVDAALATKLSLSDLLDSVYPVGSIYMSVNSANPGTIFGGTWVSFGEGRVLVGVDANDEDFDDALNTGGEATVKLEFENYQFGVWTPLAPSGQDTSTTFTAAQSGLGISSKYTANENTPHNNMPPYITCYMWRRTA